VISAVFSRPPHRPGLYGAGPGESSAPYWPDLTWPTHPRPWRAPPLRRRRTRHHMPVAIDDSFAPPAAALDVLTV